MSKTVIRVHNLGKQYRLGATLSRDTLRDLIMRAAARSVGRGRLGDVPSRKTFWALKDVSFDVQEGEVLGVIGANGAGKSTLMKILTGITEPTTGEVRSRGKLASLLEVGTGFHEELTGRENIYMNGAILGMKGREITAKFDEIVAFAEIESFLDTPVKRYSSGMRVRLAFAVAAHLEPEILLIDEGLAVGDAAFQKKCMGKMDEVAGHGRTVIFVSHNMAAVESLCPRSIRLDHGRLREAGPTIDIITRYLADVYGAQGGPNRKPGEFVAPEHAFGPVRRVMLRNATLTPTDVLRLGEACTIDIDMESADHLPNLAVGLHIRNETGHCVTSFHTRYQPCPAFTLRGRLMLRCTCPELMLVPGRYALELAVEASGRLLAPWHPGLAFQIVEADVFGTGKIPPAKDGVVASRGTWDVVRTD
ncbi:MAG: ABC transporter ATP-binding protein [Phycisphaeraceae bacterium]|nr:ABC transporter ATP-binding protein [Phycisphaeraceae bacterium]